MKSSSIRSIAVTAVLFLGIPVFAAEILHLDTASQERMGVSTRPAAEAAFGAEIRVVGEIVRAPGATLEVKSILDGRVEEIHAVPGDRVSRGDALVTLHSHTLHQLQGELLAAHAASRLAESQVEAGLELYELEGISRLELERRRQEALSARLALNMVDAELEDLGFSEAEIERLVDGAQAHPKLTVRAPAAGVVLALGVESHEWIEAYAGLMTVGDPASLELEIQVPPDESPGVGRGDRVVFAPVGRPELSGRARILTGVPQVDPRTRTVTLRAEIVEGRERFLPGVFVEGTLVLGEATSATSVPDSAVIRLSGGDHVFVRRAAESFEARPVVLGRSDGDRWEIREGLEVGEEVAVEGVFLLKSALTRAGEGG